MLEGLPVATSITMGLVMLGLTAAAFVLTVFRWWSDGIIGATEGGLILSIFAILFALLLGPIPSGARVIVALLIIAYSLGLIFIPVLLDKKSTQSFEREKEEMYRAAIKLNPGNIAARLELARNLHQQARLSEAIEELETAMTMSPKTTAGEEYTLREWVAELETRPERTLICPHCGEETTRASRVCVHCGGATTGIGELAEVLKEDFPETAKEFLAFAAALLFIVFLFSSGVPLVINIIVMIVIVGLLWRWRLSS